MVELSVDWQTCRQRSSSAKVAISGPRSIEVSRTFSLLSSRYVVSRTSQVDRQRIQFLSLCNLSKYSNLFEQPLRISAKFLEDFQYLP